MVSCPSREMYCRQSLILVPSLLVLTSSGGASANSFSDAYVGLEDFISNSGPAGVLIYIGAYVGATVLLLPASPLTIAAGFIFGPLLGTAIVSAASTAGATAAFILGRNVARPLVEKKLEGNTKFAAVDKAITNEGAKIVLLLRLSPLFPFSLLNYALSLTGVGLLEFVGASWLGMLPGTVAYVALGGAGKAAASGGLSPTQLAVYGVGVIATLAATKLIATAAGNALKEAGADD